MTSTRPTDALALPVLHPLVGYDGGTPTFVQFLDQAGITDLGYATHQTLYRTAAGGVVTSTSRIWPAKHGAPPPPLFAYRGQPGSGTALASTGMRRVSSVRLRIPGHRAQVWAFSSSGRRWAQISGGPRVHVANLVVQTVQYKTVYLSRRYGLTTLSARVVGSGQAVAFSWSPISGGAAGTTAVGTWSKPNVADVTNYFDAAEVEMTFQPGPTWVILAPRGTKVRTLRL